MPKNQTLYNALSAVFNQQPVIINEGDDASITPPPPDVSFTPTVTTLRASEVNGGEQYAVNCPHCNDTRHRLYFSHMWDRLFTFNGHQYRCPTTLMRCFNEECQTDKAFKHEVISRLREQMKRPETLVLGTGDTVPDVRPEIISDQVSMPTVRISLADPNVPANIIQYLNARKFPIKRLMDYGVFASYLPMFKNPVLIAPVYQFDNYWFWQARLIPLDGTEYGRRECDNYGEEFPKYYIPKHAKKSWALYNCDKAAYYSKVVVVEGITDVWRVGDCAVAKFGRTMSAAQRKLLRTRLSGREIVLLPDMNDPRGWGDAVETMLALKATGSFKSVKIAKLPAGEDPGSMEEVALWQIINKASDTLI